MIPFSIKDLNSEFRRKNSDIRVTGISTVTGMHFCNKLKFEISEKFEYVYVIIDGTTLVSYAGSLNNIHTLVRELVDLNHYHGTYYTNKNSWYYWSKNFYSKIDTIANYSLYIRYYVVKRGSIYRNYCIVSINTFVVGNLYITIDLHDKIIRIRRGNILSIECVDPLNLLYRYDISDSSDSNKVCDDIIKVIKYFIHPTSVSTNDIKQIAYYINTDDLSIFKVFGDDLINGALYYLYNPDYFKGIIHLDFANSMKLDVLYSSNPDNNPSTIKVKAIDCDIYYYKIYNSKTLDSLISTINDCIFGSRVSEVRSVYEKQNLILKKYLGDKEGFTVIDDLEKFIEIDESSNTVVAHHSYIIRYPGNIRLMLEVVVSKDDEYLYIECEEVSGRVKVPIVDDILGICSSYIISKFHYLQECTINLL